MGDVRRGRSSVAHLRMRISFVLILVCAALAFGAPVFEDTVPETEFAAAPVEETSRYSKEYCNRPRDSGYYGGRGLNTEPRGPSYCAGEHASMIAKMHYEQCQAGGYCRQTLKQAKKLAKKHPKRAKRK